MVKTSVLKPVIADSGIVAFSYPGDPSPEVASGLIIETVSREDN